MSKIRKLGRAISLLLKKPYLINKVLEDKDANKGLVATKYNLPSGLKEADLRLFVKKGEAEVDPFCFLEGGSLPTDLLLLRSIASSIQSCSYFEIGTWRGESVANVAAVAKDCYTMNLSDDEMRRIGLNEKYIGLQKQLSKHLKNVKHIEANSLTFDYQTLNKKFDLIFIDGDHRYEAVKSDTENCFKHLMHEKSIVVWHDYKYAPDEVRWELLLGILDGVPAEKRKNIYGVSNTLCAVYSPVPLESRTVEYPLNPDKNFNLKIKITDI